MQPIERDLGRLLLGEVTTSKEARDYFSTDGSIFTITPKLVIYPRNEDDVVSTVRYLGDKMRDGTKIPITARGKGTDQAGGALGAGAMLVFPAHMNHLVKYDRSSITVQPGMIYKHMQGILHSHHRFMPPYPASIDFATIGGAIANNSAGEKTIKYGSTRDYVQRLRVVLADSSIITTERLNKRELKKKKALGNFEGEIYRGIDELIESNQDLIAKHVPHVSKNSAGYALSRVKGKDGSFDLSQLIVGSQGTLGVVTEITLAHKPWNEHTQLLVGFFDSIEKATEATMKISKLKPSALEVVDYYLLDFLRKNQPEMIEGLVPDKLPKLALLVEFDDKNKTTRNTKARRVVKIFHGAAYAMSQSDKLKEQTALWKIRRGAAAVIWMSSGPKKALPIIEDGVVPIEKMPEFLNSVYKLFAKYKIQVAIWGHAGNANFHMQPFLNLSSLQDRKKAFALMDEFYAAVIKMGGTTCGEHNDGILRGPYLKDLYGEKMYALFEQVKNIFDPDGLLNPEVKINVSKRFAASHMRREYSMKHLHDFLPSTYNK